MASIDKSILKEFIKQFYMSLKLVQIYTTQHPNSQEGFKRSFAVMQKLFSESGEVILINNEGILFINDQPVDKATPFVDKVLEELAEKDIESITFTNKTTVEDLRELLSVISKNTYTVTKEGGVDSVLRQKHVPTIRVNILKYDVVSDGTQHYLDRMIISNYFSGKISLTRDEENLFIQEITENPKYVATILSDLLEVQEYVAGSNRVSQQITKVQELFERFSKEIFLNREEGWETHKKPLIEFIQGLDPNLQERLLQTKASVQKAGDILSVLAREIKEENIIEAYAREYQRGRKSLEEVGEAIKFFAPDIKKKKEGLPFIEERLLAGGMIPDKVKELIDQALWDEFSLEEKIRKLTGITVYGKAEVRRAGDIFQKSIHAGKIQEAQEILNRFFQTIKDTSGEVRKEVAAHVPKFLLTIEETSKDKKVFRRASKFLLLTLGQEKDSEILFTLAGSMVVVANELIARGKLIDGLEIMEDLANSQNLLNDPQFERKKLNIFQPDTLLNLLSSLKDRHADEREAIFKTMETLGIMAIEPLLEALAQEKSLQIRAKLIKAISSLKEVTLDYFVPMLSDERWFVVRNVVSILGKRKSAEAVEHLISATQHPDPRVRWEAFVALSKIPSDRSRRSILSAFEDTNSAVLTVASDIAASLGIREALPYLLKMVRKSEPFQTIELEPRTKAILAFGRLSPGRAFNDLAAILERKGLLAGGEPTEIRVSAALALGFSGNDKAMELLQQLYHKDPKAEVREAAKRAISIINSRIAKAASENTPILDNRKFDE